MTQFVFSAPAITAVPIVGTDAVYPVRRIFCVGRNYADHVTEMGGDPKDTPPVFFTKPADAIAVSGAAIPYPPQTKNLHFEVELVVALKSGGADISEDAALEHVFGCAVGNDLTRRDLQSLAKKDGAPWDMAKGFDNSAIISPIKVMLPPVTGRIQLSVNGTMRQDADLSQLIWSVPEIIATLSTYVKLCAGDLIYTGTPAGVGAILPGDQVRGEIAGVGIMEHSVV
jgi:fumarylpyruvate hydrolase